MKIRINEGGGLVIERPGSSRVMYCPFRMRHIQSVRCGDQCPLFGEPVMGYIPCCPPTKDPDTLTICQGRVLTGEIIDERKSGS